MFRILITTDVLLFTAFPFNERGLRCIICVGSVICVSCCRPIYPDRGNDSDVAEVAAAAVYVQTRKSWYRKKMVTDVWPTQS